MNQHPIEGKSMQLNQKLDTKRASPFEKEQPQMQDIHVPRKRLSPKTLASIKGGTKENPIKMDQVNAASSKM